MLLDRCTVRRTIRRTIRRSRGLFGAFCHYWVRLFHVITYRTKLWTMGCSDRYIREAFSYLVQLDNSTYGGEFWNVDEYLKFRGQGLELHVIDLEYEFVLFQDHDGELVVHEKRKEGRKVKIEGLEFETKWHEVFRTNRRIESLTFVTYLSMLYGNGGIHEPATGDRSAIAT